MDNECVAHRLPPPCPHSLHRQRGVIGTTPGVLHSGFTTALRSFAVSQARPVPPCTASLRDAISPWLTQFDNASRRDDALGSPVHCVRDAQDPPMRGGALVHNPGIAHSDSSLLRFAACVALPLPR